MSQFYLQTGAGPKGPYSAMTIAQGVREGRIPPNAQVVDVQTNELFRADAVQEDGSVLIAQPEVPKAEPAFAPKPLQMPTARPAPPYASPQPNPGNAYPPRPGVPPYPGNPYPPPPGAAPQYPGNPYPPQHMGGHQGYVPAYGQYAAPVVRQVSGLAIASLVLTLVTLVTCLPTWIGGIICGSMALKETAPVGDKEGRGMALTGLWLGVALGGLYVLFVLAFVAML